MDSNQSALDSGRVLIKALSEAGAYPHKVTAFSIIETHISWVLLTGPYAYKIKKPVNFGFLDFSTLEKRRFFCHEEIRLNRRLAPDLYLDVIPITGHPEQPEMGGAGEAIEYAVKMLQFPSALTLSELALYGQLNVNEIDQITDIVADFHDVIEKAEAASPYGHSDDVKHWFDENFDHIRPLLVDDKQKQQLQALETWGNKEWNGKAALMQHRREQGFIRECHGDLHLSNMTLINGQVTLFDCIEFNPQLRWIDVMSEVAFLVIDLINVGYEHYAFRLLNHYLQHAGDYQGLALLRYYLVYRALVCAKVSLLRKAQQQNEADFNQASLKYIGFANLAERFIQINPIALIITHGYSGSGKSTYSDQLAEKMAALQIRSDIERKRLFGYQAQADTGSGIDDGLYTQAASQKTYRHLADCAKQLIEAGFSVIVDATFLKIEQRELFKKLAIDSGVKFIIIDFQASDDELKRRVTQRKNDPSEATIAVLKQQLQSAQALSTEEQAYVITVNTESDKVLGKLLEAIAVELQVFIQ